MSHATKEILPLLRPEEAPNPTVCALVAALRLRDNETEEHCWRVARFANLLADAIETVQEGYSARNSGHRPICRRRLTVGALLHDIGKIGVPDSILLKPGALTPTEREVMQQHVVLGVEVLARVPSLTAAIPVVANHHERWDGTGYPNRRAADDIPVEARIFAIVDCYDALTSDRPYRAAMSHPEAVRIISMDAGSAYDPVFAAVFASIPASDWIEARG